MICQCCSEECDIEDMRQCDNCRALLCEACYKIHEDRIPEGHICHQCPLPQRVLAKEAP